MASEIGAFEPAILVKDTEGVVRYQNNAAISLFGRCIGMRTEDRMEPERAFLARRRDRKAMRSWTPVLFADTVRVRGEPRTFQVVKHPYVGANGKVMGVVCTLCQVAGLSNVTQNEESDEAQHRGAD